MHYQLAVLTEFLKEHIDKLEVLEFGDGWPKQIDKPEDLTNYLNDFEISAVQIGISPEVSRSLKRDSCGSVLVEFREVENGRRDAIVKVLVWRPSEVKCYPNPQTRSCPFEPFCPVSYCLKMGIGEVLVPAQTWADEKDMIHPVLAPDEFDV